MFMMDCEYLLVLAGVSLTSPISLSMSSYFLEEQTDIFRERLGSRLSCLESWWE